MGHRTKRHNLQELYEMGYQPTPGEVFIRYGKEVKFVEIDPEIRYAYGSRITDGKVEDYKTPLNDRGVIYLNEKGRKMVCFPMSQLTKVVSYEVIF